MIDLALYIAVILMGFGLLLVISSLDTLRNRVQDLEFQVEALLEDEDPSDE
jgi:hypothetical protein